MKIIAIGPMFNEGERAAEVARKFPVGAVDEILIVDDASTDDSAEKIRQTGASVLTLPERSGCGGAIRAGIDYGLKKGYDVFVVFAANGKDNPQEVQNLLRPIIEEGADFVQGSRYLPGGRWGNMPLHRKWGTRAYSLLFSLFVRYWITDGTNGFRAFRRSLLENPGVNIHQSWLDGYSVETYLFVQAIRFKYKVREAAVSKIYPPSKNGYTKMKAWSGWWNHFKPVPYLTLGLKK
jgi:dolichol-phosphate mannosyltransferase